MSKKLELTGQRFGRLLVLRKAGEDKYRASLWLCRCICGIEKVIRGGSLTRGDTKSCGCYHKGIVGLDLKGQRFGRLVVLEEDELDKWGHTRWKCICDCGTETIVNGSHLRKDGTKSCGKGSCHPCYKDGFSNTKEYSKRYREEHKEYIKKQSRQLYLKDEPKHVFSKLKARAKHRNISFVWEKEEFCDWYAKQPRLCHYCGTVIGRFSGVGHNVPNGISTDRKDNDKGYSKNNCVLCCRKCNGVKNNVFTYQEMKEVIGPLLKNKWQSNAKKGDS